MRSCYRGAKLHATTTSSLTTTTATTTTTTTIALSTKPDRVEMHALPIDCPRSQTAWKCTLYQLTVHVARPRGMHALLSDCPRGQTAWNARDGLSARLVADNATTIPF